MMHHVDSFVIYEFKAYIFFCVDLHGIAEHDMKLMCTNPDTSSIPETGYEAPVTMLSSEFTRIVLDLSQLGESVCIDVSKKGVWFYKSKKELMEVRVRRRRGK